MLLTDYVYIICSKNHEQDRWNKWNEWLINNSIKGEIFFYRWGTDLKENEIISYVIKDGTLEKIFPFRKGFPLRNSEISLGINFIKIFEDAYNKNFSKILILESDAILHPSFIKKVNGLLEKISNNEWDCISLGYGAGQRLQNQNFEYLGLVNRFRCTDSLLFNKSAIDYYYNNLKKIRLPIDEEFTMSVQMGKKSIYWLEPPITIQSSQMENGESTIQLGNPWNLKIPW